MVDGHCKYSIVDRWMESERSGWELAKESVKGELLNMDEKGRGLEKLSSAVDGK